MKTFDITYKWQDIETFRNLHRGKNGSISVVLPVGMGETGTVAPVPGSGASL